MQLSPFITDLLQTGNVIIQPDIKPFHAEDRNQVANLLAQYHNWDAFHMPLTAPAYDPFAAVWGAEFLYRALQFLLLRNLGEEEIKEHLKPFPQVITPEAAYSADLTLRNLPLVHDLAKSLSPADPFVIQLQATAKEWPFSAVGILLETTTKIPDHPSLQLAYTDRLIAVRERKIAAQPYWNQYIQVALGAHAKQFWPDFEPIHEHKS